MLKYASQHEKKKEMWFDPRVLRVAGVAHGFTSLRESLGPTTMLPYLLGHSRPACQWPRTPMTRQWGGRKGGRDHPEDIVKQVASPALPRAQLLQGTEITGGICLMSTGLHSQPVHP